MLAAARLRRCAAAARRVGFGGGGGPAARVAAATARRGRHGAVSGGCGGVARCVTSAAGAAAVWEAGGRLEALEDTERVAKALADVALPGDVIFLRGDVGAGKSTFARALLRRACADAAMHVPSPTYTLRNDYDAADGRALAHFDLYRLDSGGAGGVGSSVVEGGGHGSEGKGLGRVQLDEAFAGAVSLVEWPDRMGEPPVRRLELCLTIPPEQRPSAANGWGADGDDDGHGAPRGLQARAYGGDFGAVREALRAAGVLDSDE